MPCGPMKYTVAVCTRSPPGPDAATAMPYSRQTARSASPEPVKKYQPGIADSSCAREYASTSATRSYRWLTLTATNTTLQHDGPAAETGQRQHAAILVGQREARRRPGRRRREPQQGGGP